MPYPRGNRKREHVLDVDVLAGHDHFLDQALGNRLTLFESQPVKIITQQVVEGFGVLDDLLPMKRLLLRLRQALAFRLEAPHLGRQFLPPRVQFDQRDALGLIGVH